MTQKTKALILIPLILVATFVFGTYLFKQKQLALYSQEKQNSQIVDQGRKTVDEKNKTVTAKILNGKVSAIAKDSVDIESKDGKRAFSLNENTAVTLVFGEKIEKKSIADIKKGDNASVITNRDDGSVISIQIGKDAGSVF